MQSKKFLLPTVSAIMAFTHPVAAHYTLTFPKPLGDDIDKMTSKPCGAFDKKDRSKGVQNWPMGGQAIAVRTLHDKADWHYKAALLSEPDTWKDLTPVLHQKGMGDFCIRDVPGMPGWQGKEAILQVTQHGEHGDLYSCAAIKFVAGSRATPPSVCANSTGVTSSWTRTKYETMTG